MKVSSFRENNGLLPYQGRSALGTLFLHTGYAALMRFGVSAVGTHADPAAAPRRGAAHASAPLAATPLPLALASTLALPLSLALAATLALALSLALPLPLPLAATQSSSATLSSASSSSHSTTTSFSVHWTYLLIETKSLATPPGAASATTRHDKGTALHIALEPCLDDLAKIPGNKRDYFDAIRADQLMHGPGNRPANQCSNPQLDQSQRFLQRQVFRQHFLGFTDNPPGFGLDDMQLVRGIENRRDAGVPIGKSGSHHSRPVSPSTP